MNGTLLAEPIAAVIEKTSNGEEVLEEFGIDYWFGSRRTLEEACREKHADPAVVVERLCIKAAPARSPQLPELLATIDTHFESAIAPAMAAVRTAAASVPADKRRDIFATLEAIATMLDKHLLIYRVHVLTAMRTPGSRLEQSLVRELARQHAVLAIRVSELVTAAKSAAVPALLAAATALAREIHHHLRLAYNDVMPALFLLAAMKRPTGIEPW